MRTLLNVSSKYSAPLGRRNNATETDLPVKFRMQRLRWVDYDYDQGGAYWGHVSGEHIYWAYGDGETEEQVIYVRAKSRAQAKVLVRETFPDAKFYR